MGDQRNAELTRSNDRLGNRQLKAGGIVLLRHDAGSRPAAASIAAETNTNQQRCRIQPEEAWSRVIDRALVCGDRKSIRPPRGGVTARDYSTPNGVARVLGREATTQLVLEGWGRYNKMRTVQRKPGTMRMILILSVTSITPHL